MPSGPGMGGAGRRGHLTRDRLGGDAERHDNHAPEQRGYQEQDGDRGNASCALGTCHGTADLHVLGEDRSRPGESGSGACAGR